MFLNLEKIVQTKIIIFLKEKEKKKLKPRPRELAKTFFCAKTEIIGSFNKEEPNNKWNEPVLGQYNNFNMFEHSHPHPICKPLPMSTTSKIICNLFPFIPTINNLRQCRVQIHHHIGQSF
jgi:hypothetical protein